MPATPPARKAKIADGANGSQALRKTGPSLSGRACEKCRSAKSDDYFWHARPFSCRRPFSWHPWTSCLFSWRLFVIVSLDIVSFFIPSSFFVVSWAKAAGASARLSEKRRPKLRARCGWSWVVIPLNGFESDACRPLTTIPLSRLLLWIENFFCDYKGRSGVKSARDKHSTQACLAFVQLRLPSVESINECASQQ